MTNDIKTMLADHIQRSVEIASRNNIWIGGYFKAIQDLAIDLRGELGESYIADLLIKLGHGVEMARQTDRSDKHWDIRVNGKIDLEIKTATIGKKGKTFQHENIEKERRYDAIVLLDIAPDNIYLTVAPKNTLPYATPNNNWTLNPKKMHRRAHGIQYKWDLHLNDVKERRVETLDDVRRQFAILLGAGND